LAVFGLASGSILGLSVIVDCFYLAAVYAFRFLDRVGEGEAVGFLD